MTLKINPEAIDVTKVVYALVQQNSRQVVSTVADLTNSSGGTAGATVVALKSDLVDVAATGTDLASKTTAEASIATVVDALAEVYAKANAYADKLGINKVTYNGGGAAADGTIAAITVATTGAATGAQAAATNASLAAINSAIYNVTTLTNRIAKATGIAGVKVFATEGKATIPAIPVTVGTAASPGITKVALDAELVKAANNIATIATVLNSLNTGIGNALVIAE